MGLCYCVIVSNTTLTEANKAEHLILGNGSDCFTIIEHQNLSTTYVLGHNYLDSVAYSTSSTTYIASFPYPRYLL